jgi:CHAT domain-containing protein
MIGVPRVIATLWPVDDEASASISALFYETLALDDATWRTAEALHQAVKLYMEMDDGIGTNTESFLSWVPLVHYGI